MRSLLRPRIEAKTAEQPLTRKHPLSPARRRKESQDGTETDRAFRVIEILQIQTGMIHKKVGWRRRTRTCDGLCALIDSGCLLVTVGESLPSSTDWHRVPIHVCQFQGWRCNVPALCPPAPYCLLWLMPKKWEEWNGPAIHDAVFFKTPETPERHSRHAASCFFYRVLRHYFLGRDGNSKS